MMLDQKMAAKGIKFLTIASGWFATFAAQPRQLQIHGIMRETVGKRNRAIKGIQKQITMNEIKLEKWYALLPDDKNTHAPLPCFALAHFIYVGPVGL